MFQSFLLITLFAVLLYGLGYLLGHKGKKVKHKEEPYSAGIDLPIVRQRYESNIGMFALLFLVFDILAFMIVISKGVFYPVLYISIVLLGIVLVRKSVV